MAIPRVDLVRGEAACAESVVSLVAGERRALTSSCSDSIPFTVVPVSSRIYEEMERMRGFLSSETARQSPEGSLERRPVTKMMVISVFIVAALWQAPTLHAETSYYVQSSKAKVMSGATFTSTVLGEVSR